jgi:hypothetical protein
MSDVTPRSISPDSRTTEPPSIAQRAAWKKLWARLLSPAPEDSKPNEDESAPSRADRDARDDREPAA